MPTIRLIPSTYAVSNTSYVSTSNPNNALTNTDSTTYGQFTHNRSSNSAYYVYLRGFNFSDVPSGVIINSFTIKIRGLESGLSTSATYNVRLCNNTTEISDTTASTSFSTSNQTITIPNGSLTWDTITGYGSNFGIYVPIRRNSKNTSGYVRIYGAEILVDYTIPVYHSVSFNNTSSVSISPSTAQSVVEGNNLTIQINTSNKNAIRVSDNNVDVSSQIVQGTSNCTYTISNVQADHTISVTDAPSYNVSITNNSETVTTQPSSTQTLFEGDSQSISFYNISSLDDVEITDNSNDIESQLVHSTGGTRNTSYIPDTLVDSNGNVANTNNGLTDHTSTTYAQTNGQSQHYLMYQFNVPAIPSGATNISVSCIAKVQHTRSTASGEVQLYSGNTAKGSVSTFGNTATTVNLTTGTWTASELGDVRIRIGNSYTGGTTTYYTRFYGATLTVNYTVVEDVYTYTISNISTNHTIAIADASSSSIPYFLKVNNEFRQVDKIYRKVNNVWVEISAEDLAAVQGPYFYKGHTVMTGSVSRSDTTTSIIINDGALPAGNYTLRYEDSNGSIISNIDEIANITIS